MRAGIRVRDKQWGGVHTGAITRVDSEVDLIERRADGDTDPTLYLYVQWDGANFSEDQLAPSEVELIDGEDDPALRSAIVFDPAGPDGEIGIRPCRCFGEGCRACDNTGVIYP